MISHLADKFRAGGWLIAGLVLAALVGFLHPHQLGVLLWSLLKLAAGAYLGYWVDRSIFYYARPGEILKEAGMHGANQDVEQKIAMVYMALGAMLRRALIMAAAIVALGLGV